MNQELLHLIAKGRTAEVYAWGPDAVLKLYQDWCPPHWIDQEMHAAQVAHQAGLATPAVLERIERDGRQGLVFERIEGVSMLADLNRRPWQMFNYARELARLQVQINQLEIPGLSSFREGLRWTIEHSAHVPPAVRQKALAALASLPEGTTVCHADFHPENVMVTAQGPVVIDWMTVRAGSPWADVARTSMILTVGPLDAGDRVSALTLLGVRWFHRIYLNTYRSIVHDRDQMIRRWLPVVAAARLEEYIPPEREAVIKLASQ